MPDISAGSKHPSGETPPSEIYLGHLVKIVSERFRSRNDAVAQTYGLTSSQAHLLFYLHRCGGSVQQKEIVRFLHVSHPTVVGLLSRMEKKGFISIAQDPQDHRNRIIYTTAAADEVMRNTYEDMVKTNLEAKRGFSPEEYEQLSQYLLRIYHNLTQTEDDGNETARDRNR